MKRATRDTPAPVRAMAAAAALAAGGFLIGVPAQAAPGSGVSADTPPEPPAASYDSGLPPGLAEALKRDLGITEEEFQAAGDAGSRAAAALPALQTTEGFTGLELRDGEILIYGTGAALQAQADALGARLLAPAETGDADVPAPVPAEPESEDPAGEPAAEDPAGEPAPAEVTQEPAPAPPDNAKVPDAAGQPQRTATDLAELARDYIASFGVQGLQSIGMGADGFTIRVADPEVSRAQNNARMATAAAPAPADYAEGFTNVTIQDAAGAGTPLAQEVFGGQGFLGDAGAGYAACSIGFNGWDPSGNPAVITAGHCTLDGTVQNTLLAPETQQDPVTTGLGTFGASVFGGPGNATVDPENPDPATFGTDVAVIDSINPDLELRPEVTEWAGGSLSETTTQITGVGTPVVGSPVCRSGLTTGWDCGTVVELAIFAVPGHNNGTDPADIRAVTGFISDFLGAPGDSGGPVISGNTAVGLVSAGFDTDDDGAIDRVGSADLATALAYVPGYSIAMFMAAPTLDVADGDTVYTDQLLSGTAPAGSVVRVSVAGAGGEIPVGADGSWSMLVPRTVQDGEAIRVSLTAASGFNKSETTVYNLVAAHSALDAPVLLSPADGSAAVGALSTIAGLAEPGATVEIALSTAGTAEVEGARALAAPAAITVLADSSGAFSATLAEPLTPGNYLLAATQDGIAGKTVSAAASAAFSVLHPAPAITSIRDGEVFTEASAPRTISGTGIAGAALTLSTGSSELATVVADDGTWSIDAGTWSAGEFTVTAAQELDGVGSAPATVTFQVTALQAAAVTRTPGGLAATGADAGSLTAVLSAAGVLLVGGAAGIGWSRRRSTRGMETPVK
ncbi:trypsin-like serine protease [Arthrobacter koreensis]|uniref:trypsin-like serine protease n=1 Tax=Arthrobacter koreensis TaxID=199136 RepID=UPI002DB7DBD3|nr:trypsin-like serine protease [Arthrobacter koreensis]MEB7502927.1 trypsin-like serine protease [Arthrobacter koreensis]